MKTGWSKEDMWLFQLTLLNKRVLELKTATLLWVAVFRFLIEIVKNLT
ncbi:hypothetical protein NDK43_13840 [Neobacillus pocheonensis]|uniref:Uncharacterized protein n=1 Tax=Neobacillus pocheonensis TaxID=363869 RepID=A0ABT0WAI0_9BACI|nr:hypothetical protein [Neobacillus pocheonensis]